VFEPAVGVFEMGAAALLAPLPPLALQKLQACAVAKE